MSDESSVIDRRTDSAFYEIILEGCLEDAWKPWFEGFSISVESGCSRLRGEVVDQAALHGILRGIRDIGLPLVSLRRLPGVETAQSAGG
ncbi:MAG: hypothetical protein ACPGSC_03830 [Granulosicoccaceae bacterium]